MTDWFRSWHGAPTDPKWLGIAKRTGVAPGIVVAVAWALMDRASQASDRGSIEGYDAEGLAAFFGCEPEHVDEIVGCMIDRGMVAHSRFMAWEKRQPKREDGAAERAKEWRERNRTQPNADEPPDTETEKIQIEKEEPTGSSKKRGTRLPENWKPDIPFALSVGLSHSQALNEAQAFREWWPAQPGQKGVKADWDLTWRTWCRRAAAKRPASTAPPSETVGSLSRKQLFTARNDIDATDYPAGRLDPSGPRRLEEGAGATRTFALEGDVLGRI